LVTSPIVQKVVGVAHTEDYNVSHAHWCYKGRKIDWDHTGCTFGLDWVGIGGFDLAEVEVALGKNVGFVMVEEKK